jgi:hypothetical protein
MSLEPCVKVVRTPFQLQRERRLDEVFSRWPSSRVGGTRRIYPKELGNGIAAWF